MEKEQRRINQGIIICKNPGSLIVTGRNVIHPRLPDTANQLYVPFDEAPVGLEVGHVVEFEWDGTPPGPFKAMNLRLASDWPPAPE